MTPRALQIQNEASGPARLFVEELEVRGFEVVIDPEATGDLRTRGFECHEIDLRDEAANKRPEAWP